MGINIKYYIISIAAIFISLGIGIFIGFNMNGQELFLEQQQILVDSLEDRFSEFQKEKETLEQKIQSLSAEKEKQNIFIENVFYEVIHNKLSELDIAIIETTDHYFYDDINETLRLSGADVPLHVKYTDKIYTVTEDQLKEINESIGTDLKKNDDFINLINNEVANFFIYKDMTDILKFLIDNEYIIYNFNYNNIDQLNVDNIIIAGGSTKNQENKTEQLDINLVKNLQDKDLNVIGVERLDVELSYIPELKKLNIPTVDNVNTKIGQISLVYVLRGAEGHYGEKPSAESLAPFIVTDPS